MIGVEVLITRSEFSTQLSPSQPAPAPAVKVPHLVIEVLLTAPLPAVEDREVKVANFIVNVLVAFLLTV
jgi:hypothetical protein